MTKVQRDVHHVMCICLHKIFHVHAIILHLEQRENQNNRNDLEGFQFDMLSKRYHDSCNGKFNLSLYLFGLNE